MDVLVTARESRRLPARRQFTVFSDNSGDLGPEGLSFIPAAESPTGTPVVAVANEVSGSTTLFEVAVTR